MSLLFVVVSLLLASSTCHGFLVTSTTHIKRVELVQLLSAGPSGRHQTSASLSDDSSDRLRHAPSHRILSPVLSAVFLSAVILVSSVNAFDVTVYNNNYGDPFHPLCKRRVEVSADGTTFHYSGTAVGPKDDPVRRGCTVAEIEQYKLRQGAFDGFILRDGKISAGDGIHEGVWEPANTATTKLGYEDFDGIRWNDGNKWFVVKSVEEASAPSI